MKIHLIFSPSSSSSSLEVLGENTWPPLGILYLAGYLRQQIPDLGLFVTDGCRLGYEKTLQEVFKIRPHVVGISFYSTQTLGACMLARTIREGMPDVFIVMGGPHATALPDDVLLNSQADVCVLGEGEHIFFNIVKALRDSKDKQFLKTLNGVAVIEEDDDGSRRVYRSKPADLIPNLDTIPFPARDLVDLTSYRGWFLSKNIPQTTMLFTRGCPYQCTYCANSVWRTSRPLVRVRSPENIVDEMEYLKDTYGIREIYDQADEFNHSIQHPLSVCSEMIRRKVNMSWQVSLRASPFSEELSRQMAAAGCWCASLGIESANLQTIRGIKKHITLEDVENTSYLLRKHGIKVRAHFMLYNVWEEDGRLSFEDTQMSQETLLYAKRLFKLGLINYITWSITTPFPGSELYEIAVRHRLISSVCENNWDEWLQKYEYVMDLPNIDQKERQRLKRAGEFLRIRTMLYNRDYKLKDLPLILKRGLSVFRKLL
jgi:anaerobic magnesium-protoporphyrin IX monomethyl ester cyclase